MRPVVRDQPGELHAEHRVLEPRVRAATPGRARRARPPRRTSRGPPARGRRRRARPAAGRTPRPGCRPGRPRGRRTRNRSQRLGPDPAHVAGDPLDLARRGRAHGEQHHRRHPVRVRLRVGEAERRPPGGTEDQPALDAQVLADRLHVPDERGGRVAGQVGHGVGGRRRAVAAVALVDHHGAVDGRVEQAVHAAGRGAGPPCTTTAGRPPGSPRTSQYTAAPSPTSRRPESSGARPRVRRGHGPILPQACARDDVTTDCTPWTSWSPEEPVGSVSASLGPLQGAGHRSGRCRGAAPDRAGCGGTSPPDWTWATQRPARRSSSTRPATRAATRGRSTSPAPGGWSQAVDRDRLQHLVYVSIVGVDRDPLQLLPRQVRRRAGAARLRPAGHAAPGHPVPRLRRHAARRRPGADRCCRCRWAGGLQPVDVDEVAAHIGEWPPRRPPAGCVEFGGPEELTAADVARAWAGARGSGAHVVATPVPGKMGAAIRDGAALPTGGARGTAHLRPAPAGLSAARPRRSCQISQQDGRSRPPCPETAGNRRTRHLGSDREHPDPSRAGRAAGIHRHRRSHRGCRRRHAGRLGVGVRRHPRAWGRTSRPAPSPWVGC